MKKLLLLLSVFSLNTFFAQVLETDNYNALTVGNVSTNITGASAGQGGNYLFASGGAVTDAQIFNEGGIYDKVLQITGSNAALNKFVFKQGLGALWTARTAGNNIVDIEYEFFTGAATTSKNVYDLRLYDAPGKTLAGITFASDTKIIRGLAYYTSPSNPVNTYAFSLGATSTDPLVLPVNTWVKVGFSFNKTTGEVKWKGSGFDSFIIGAAIGLDIDEVDYIVIGGTGNAVSTTAKFDNYSAIAKQSSNLLGNNESIITKFSIYPNPTNDIVNITKNGSLEIITASITDINGRVVKQVNNDVSTINVSDLNAGVYFLKLATNEGSGVTKLIKN